jgi:hypothetical protein
MRYRLRTLLIALAVVPPVLAYMAVVVWYLISEHIYMSVHYPR